MSATFVGGRLHLDPDGEQEDEMKLAKTRTKFRSLGQALKAEERTRRMGEHREKKEMTFTQKLHEGVPLDSDSDFEPEEEITSVNIGMIPEFIFNIFMFIKVVIAFYLFALGLTVMRWKASIQSFINPHYDSDFNEETQIQKPVQEDNYNESGITGAAVNIGWIGVFIMVIAIFDIIFTLLFWHSVFKYKKQRIFVYFVVLVLLELLIIFFGWTAHTKYTCNMHIIQAYLDKYIKKFGKDKLSTRKINEIQLDLGCCGVKDWTDFIKLKVSTDWGLTNEASDIDYYQQKEQTLVPFTCCKFPWNGNLYCAFDAYKWYVDDEFFAEDIKKRFYTTGCKQKMEDYCHRTVSLLSNHMELIYVAELLIMIVLALMGYFILQKINLMKLEAQALYDFNKLEIVDNAFESDDSAEFDNLSDEEGGGGGDTKQDQSQETQTLKEIHDDINLLESHQGGIRLLAKLQQLQDEHKRDGQDAQKHALLNTEGRMGGDLKGTDNTANQTQTQNPYQEQKARALAPGKKND